MNVDIRVTIAAEVGKALTKVFKGSTARLTETSSGCPLLNFAVEGKLYNLTVTKSRKKP